MIKNFFINLFSNSIRMEFIFITVLKLDAPNYKEELIEEVSTKKKILVRVNSEKIVLTKKKIVAFISENIGSPDEIGAGLVLKSHGLKNIQKFPEVELWLEIIQKIHSEKSFYLIGGKKEVILALITLVKQNYPGIKILGFRKD